jgi:hypothetical protein
VAFRGSGGGGGAINGGTGGAGSGGVVILRAPSKAAFTISPGTNTISTTPTGEVVAKFTVSGTIQHG